MLKFFRNETNSILIRYMQTLYLYFFQIYLKKKIFFDFFYKKNHELIFFFKYKKIYKNYNFSYIYGYFNKLRLKKTLIIERFCYLALKNFIFKKSKKK